MRGVSAAFGIYNHMKEGEAMVELDQFKVILNSYAGPLVEVRDSL